MAETRSIHDIAIEIRKDWSLLGNGVNFAAEPYLQAMLTLDKITDPFGLDPGDEIVMRFLVNAGTWRGDTARRVKLELKSMLKK